ncbi:MAG TPA: PH domain-containing protein, partial [Miltoncostaeaceae bacterium]|nr:PH domain-containing protein [Miltoncostaeaceae bacterium]
PALTCPAPADPPSSAIPSTVEPSARTTALGIALEGGSAGAGQVNAGIGDSTAFGTGDRVAIAVFGWACGAALLLLTRPRLVADAGGVRVRNVGGWRHLPWGVVRAVRLDEGAPWLVLHLHDDETVSALAVQGSDGERARQAAAGVAALHRAHGAPAA